jgi:hypothetical protein
MINALSEQNSLLSMPPCHLTRAFYLKLVALRQDLQHGRTPALSA